MEQETINNSLIRVIKIITKLFGSYNYWAITGSTNLAIRGAKIQPSDIDIITTHNTADQFAFLTRNIAPLKFVSSKNKTINSYYATTKLEGVSIDVMADAIILTHYGVWQPLDTWSESIEYIQTKFGLVLLTSLEFERHVYSLLNFQDRVEIIDSLTIN